MLTKEQAQIALNQLISLKPVEHCYVKRVGIESHGSYVVRDLVGNQLFHHTVNLLSGETISTRCSLGPEVGAVFAEHYNGDYVREDALSLLVEGVGAGEELPDEHDDVFGHAVFYQDVCEIHLSEFTLCLLTNEILDV